MGRPVKHGVDYFPHDVDASSRKTLFTIESKFGNDGYAFWFKLLEVLGQQDGLLYDMNSAANRLFLESKCRLSEVSVTEILDMLSKLGAIDEELWLKKIIWSQHFAERLSSVFIKRNVSVAERPCIDSLCSRNSTSAVVSATESTQSKVKKRKVNKATTEDFDKFWESYPKKDDKLKAIIAFNKLNPSEELLTLIIYDIVKRKRCKKWTDNNGQYIPNPATYLNGRRWEDEIKIENHGRVGGDLEWVGQDTQTC